MSAVLHSARKRKTALSHFLRSFLNIPSVDDSMTACSPSPSSIGSTSTAAEAAVEAGGGGGGETAAAAALERSNEDEKN